MDMDVIFMAEWLKDRSEVGTFKDIDHTTDDEGITFLKSGIYQDFVLDSFADGDRGELCFSIFDQINFGFEVRPYDGR